VAQQLGDLSLNATIGVAANVSLTALIDNFTARISVGERTRDGIGAWWTTYISQLIYQREVRLAQEEAARLAQLEWRKKHAVEGDGWACMPMPIASGMAFHDPDAADAEFIAAMLPWLRRAA
jgi:hypothetical protein